MIAENKSLNLLVLRIMDDDKYHSVGDLKKMCKCFAIDLKEALLFLLQNGKVQCAGSRWKKVSDNNLESQEEEEVSDFFITCLQCNAMLAIRKEYIGRKVSCPCCSSVSYVSSRQCAENEYVAIPAKNVDHE